MANPAIKSEILLETGTNEVEIAEFKLCGQSFGVNVAKIREFLPYDGVTVTKMPGRHHSILGVFILRGRSIPLIALDSHLQLNRSEDLNARQVVVVTEFNNMTTAFVADFINRIHRVSWADFQPLDMYLATQSSMIVGSINIEGREVLVLDLEHIIGEIFPHSIINYNEETFAHKHSPQERSDVRLVFAEDSPIIRKQVSNILQSVGFEHITAFDNGQAALEGITEMLQQGQEEGKDISNYINVLLTDIEMPKMDGLTLCRKIKREMQLDIPVIMFSSLINEQMEKKCQRVGANGFANKPDTEKLINLLDDVTLGV